MASSLCVHHLTEYVSSLGLKSTEKRRKWYKQDEIHIHHSILLEMQLPKIFYNNTRKNKTKE